MDILRPSKWIIEIEQKEDGKWYEKYIELFPDSGNIREVRDGTMTLLMQALNMSNFEKYDVKPIEMNGMVGVEITTIAKTLAPSANQIVSEFAFMSELGDISLRDIITIGLQQIVQNKQGKKLLKKASTLAKDLEEGLKNIKARQELEAKKT